MPTSGTEVNRPLLARPSRGLKGRVTVPGDKSVSHRAVMLGLLSVGETRISGLLEGEDVLATAAAARQLGAIAERHGPGDWSLWGRGIGGLGEPEDILDFGNSGTSARLMMGILGTHPIDCHMTGDASLRKRPMERALKPIRLFGAEATTTDGRLPIFLKGARNPVPVAYEVPVASAQVKSAVILAGLNTPGRTTVIEPIATRDHTERMLRHFGAAIDVTQDGAKTIIALTGQPELKGARIDVPADPSSAAFPIVAALITPDSDVTISGVLMNPTRTGLFTTLAEMGADLTIENERDVAGERIADIRARSSALKGVDVPPERAASMIDEYPVLAAAAALAKGRTRMMGLEELRVKESDRLSAIAAGLARAGVSVRVGETSLEVTGSGGAPIAGGETIATHMDHRIAMAFLTLGLGSNAGIAVDDGRMIATSFPGYLELMQGLGANISLKNIG